MEYAIQILEERLQILTSVLTQKIYLKDKPAWKAQNAKKRTLKRAIQILRSENKP